MPRFARIGSSNTCTHAHLDITCLNTWLNFGGVEGGGWIYLEFGCKKKREGPYDKVKKGFNCCFGHVRRRVSSICSSLSQHSCMVVR